MKYVIYIEDQSFEVSGDEYAAEVFTKACELGELLGRTVYLVDGYTGEILSEY